MAENKKSAKNAS